MTDAIGTATYDAVNLDDRSPATRSRPLRCLWLSKGLGRGGAERLLVDMLPLMDRASFTIDVAYVLPWKDNYHNALEDNGADVHCLGSARPGDPRWLFRLSRLMAARDYDIVHTHAPLPGVGARVVPRSRTAVVHTEHNMWDRYRWPTRALNSLTYHRNTSVVAVSDSVAETIRPAASARKPPVTVIHHGTSLNSVVAYDPVERLRRRRVLGLPADRTIIMNVGNFTVKKDHMNLLRALAGEGPITGAHLALIGLGPLEQDLRVAAAELGISDRVTFLGSRDDVFELLPLADVFCLSSQFEGFPIALVEAMATGLPCVATAVGGIPELIEDGTNGLLVRPGSPPALQSAIERFIQDPELARTCAVAGRDTALSLDLRHAVRRLEQIYVAATSTLV